MRILITLSVLIVYVSLFSGYIHELPRPNLSMYYCKIYYSALTLGMLLFYRIDRLFGIASYYHSQLNEICFWSVVINFLLILGILTGLLNRNNWQSNFYMFNGSILAVSLMVFISMARHGYFKEKYEND